MTTTFEQMRALKIPGRHGYAVQYSPFFPNFLAVAGGQHYGIVGSGSLFVIRIGPDALHIDKHLRWNQTLFDVAWSETNENLLLTAGGRGTLQLWDLAAHTPATESGPARVLEAHSKEVSSVSWCPSRDGANQVVSTSWDHSCLLWDMTNLSSVQQFVGHSGTVYGSSWNVQRPLMFATVSADHTARVWSVSNGQEMLQLDHGPCEVLCVDWNKYDEHSVVTASTDRMLRAWDLRKARSPVMAVSGGSLPVRRLKTSPFRPDVFITAGYDFSVRVWNLGGNCLETIEQHTEFTCGLDFNLHVPGQIADCSWDETIKVYQPHSLRS